MRWEPSAFSKIELPLRFGAIDFQFFGFGSVLAMVSWTSNSFDFNIHILRIWFYWHPLFLCVLFLFLLLFLTISVAFFFLFIHKCSLNEIFLRLFEHIRIHPMVKRILTKRFSNEKKKKKSWKIRESFGCRFRNKRPSISVNVRSKKSIKKTDNISR